MAFKVDNQTINDLKIIGGSREQDIFGLYNKTRTRGGARILKDMFMYPRSREDEIMQRVNTIKYFQKSKLEFPFDASVFDIMEHYLKNTDERTRLMAHSDNLKRKFNNAIGADTDYQLLHKGVVSTLIFLTDLKKFIISLDTNGSTAEFSKDIKSITTILDLPELAFLNEEKLSLKPGYGKTAEYDQIFRFTELRGKIQKLLYHAYDIDVFVAVAQVATERNFCYAGIYKGEDNLLEMKNVYHPLVPNAVGNDVLITEDSNMVFLTGANMAGKSTFMKTFSIAIYLAHMGFPLPADSMHFSIQNGMFTTINLADNLNLGFSHFYSEVNRVRKVAESVNQNERLIVLFDELFRGTNVKDAYDATVAVMNSFATKRKCTFVISTHIIEAGEDLKKMRDNIKFMYLPTIMNGKVPEYTYKITEGITEDRHGMIIIRNEKILDILEAKN